MGVRTPGYELETPAFGAERAAPLPRRVHVRWKGSPGPGTQGDLGSSVMPSKDIPRQTGCESDPRLLAASKPHTNLARAVSRLDVDDTRPAAHRTILRVRLPGATAAVDEDLLGFAAERAGDRFAAAPRLLLLHRGPNGRGSWPYFLASAATFSRYFLTISSCSCFGTTAYLANSIVKVPLPWVAERRSVE